MKAMLSLLVLGLSSTGFCIDGGSSSGGGNVREIEFHARIDKIAQILQNPEVADLYRGTISSHELDTIADLIQVNFLDTDLFKEGIRKDALNFPSERRILVSQTSWDKLANNTAQKDLLVFHEMLGLLERDDSNYRHSRKLLPFIARHDTNHCEENADYQYSNIEGIWAFNNTASVLVKISLSQEEPASPPSLRVEACDRAKYLETAGTCSTAYTPDGRAYPAFSARFSATHNRFQAPDYFSIKVDCTDTKQLVYEKDSPDGSGLSYRLRKK